MLQSLHFMKILGIDPGYGRIGYGVIEQVKGKDWQSVEYGCLETSMKDDFINRLKEVHTTIVSLIKKHSPARVAVEDLFFFKNLKTAIKVSQARGVILLAAVENNIPVDEFTPLQVKQAMTGYGRAEKAQIQKIVALILGIKEKIRSDDAADALALALTSAQSMWVKSVKKE
jgi:crossover junction endodeoxyribonuclease RuvC